MLSLNLLKVFNAVAEHNSVVRASEKLFISQPAVSSALKKLQGEIDLRLFKKSGRNLVLTEHGEMLLQLTRRMFDTEKEIEDLVAHLNSREMLSMHIGLVTIYERFGVEEILHDFAEIDKNISVSIHSGNSAAVVKMLGDKIWDMGIAGDIVKNNKLLYTPYRQHEVFMVAPKGHRLYGKRFFTAGDINGNRVVLKEFGSSVRATIDNFIRRDKVQIVPIMELSNIDAILNLVEAEKCITFLPDLSIINICTGRFSKSRLKGEKLLFSTYAVTYKPEEYTSSKQRIIGMFLDRVRQTNALRQVGAPANAS